MNKTESLPLYSIDGAVSSKLGLNLERMEYETLKNKPLVNEPPENLLFTS